MSVWFVVALTALATAPTPGSGAVAVPPADPSPIVGGEPVKPGEADAFSAVVAVVYGSVFCTGTLVEDGLVLTAAHCLRSASDASTIRVYNGLSLVNPGVSATGFGMHPDFDVEAKRDAFDYGFVTIPLGSLDATPIPVVTDQDEWDAIAAGLSGEDAVTLVGYGLDPDAPPPTELGIKRLVTTSVKGFTDSGLEFVAGGDGKDSCEGDSGGPALARNADGEFRLIGITARGSDPCGKGGFYGVPYHALAWVSEATGQPRCGDTCGTCDCLDTAPPSDEGCGCTSDPRSGTAWLWMLALGLGFRARRRSTR